MQVRGSTGFHSVGPLGHLSVTCPLDRAVRDGSWRTEKVRTDLLRTCARVDSAADLISVQSRRAVVSGHQNLPEGRDVVVERWLQVLIMLAIGAAAGAGSFRHVHDVAAAHGQGGWLAWADAVVLEWMSVASGLELRRRKRLHEPVTFPAIGMGVAVVLSVSAQVVEAERSPIGWIGQRGHADGADRVPAEPVKLNEVTGLEVLRDPVAGLSARGEFGQDGPVEVDFLRPRGRCGPVSPGGVVARFFRGAHVPTEPAQVGFGAKNPEFDGDRMVPPLEVAADLLGPPLLVSGDLGGLQTRAERGEYPGRVGSDPLRCSCADGFPRLAHSGELEAEALRDVRGRSSGLVDQPERGDGSHEDEVCPIALRSGIRTIRRRRFRSTGRQVKAPKYNNPNDG